MAKSKEMTLHTFMQKKPCDLGTFVVLALALAEMLRKLHLRGLLRYNLHPERITIHPPSGRLTFLAVQPDALPADERAAEQQEKDLISAFAYISPEQTGRMRRKVDSRSDLYALGVLLYELLTGILPMKGGTANEWVHAHMAWLPIPPRTINPDIPPILNDLVLKLLSKSPEHRYQSAYGLHYDLRKCSVQLQETGVVESFSLGEADEIARFQLPEKLYDREQEVQALLSAYERSRSGSMELMLVGGYAGSGKTALIKSIHVSMVHNSGYMISGKFDQLRHSIPYAALISAFRDLVRQVLSESDTQIVRWKKKLLAALGPNGTVIAEVIPELTLIIGKQAPVTELPPSASTSRFQTLFSRFIKVFADKRHPLTLFLDDLQWADPESFQLLRSLIHDASNQYVLIICTYRSNELRAGSANTEGLDSLLGTGVRIQWLTVKPLGYRHVLRYIAGVLHTELNRIKPLADAIYRKTAGNPFYIRQMLQCIYDEKLLYFHSDRMSWEWDMTAIMEREGFKDVISLIEGRFHTLPETTHRVLRLAGCIGNAFDIRMLSLLCEQTIEHTEQDLLPALNEGLVLAEQDTYLFLHDRVQKAAYDLIPDEEKKRVHLQIGRLLLDFFDTEATEEHLFDVVHHLNLGSGFMTDPTEMEQLARLNLQAGRKAKASAAYVCALQLLKKGAQLIEAEGWSRKDMLYYQLLLESSECEYFCGYFDQAEAVLERLLLHVTRLEYRAKVYVVQITMYAFLKREDIAGEIALKAMAEFHLIIPSKPSRLSIAAEILLTQAWLAKHRNRQGLMQPSSNDPLHQALADIVMAASPILFNVNYEKAAIVFAKYVRISVKQRYTEAFAIALGSYAITLAYGLKGYRAALQLADLALKYSEQTASGLVRGKNLMILTLISQFVRPQELGQSFQQAGQLSLEAGDLVYAGYAISSQLITDSEDLRHLNQVCIAYKEKASRVLDELTLKVLHQTMHYVHLLQHGEESYHQANEEEQAGEERLLPEEAPDNQSKGNRFYYYTCKIEIYYLYGHYSEAAACAEKTKSLGSSILQAVKQRHCFYHALALMAQLSGASAKVRRRFRRIVKTLLAQMKQWAKSVPVSTMAKYKLMQAEQARWEQDPMKATALYDQAIQWAQQADSARDEAIANELAAQCYFSLGKQKVAEAYLEEACMAYFRWGATGKLRQLQERYPALKQLSFTEQAAAEEIPVHTEGKRAAQGGMSRGLNKVWDMDMLRQAAKMESMDGAEESGLPGSFLELAVGNAGAERGFFLLEKKGELVVEAKKDINRRQMGPGCNEPLYSAAVVQFVLRTGEAVVLGEAHQSLFAADPYIRRNRPLSILCLPIRYPDQRTGILYLENNLVSDAFSGDRLEVLEIAFSRMVYLKQRQSPDRAGEADYIGGTSMPALIEPLTHREKDILRLIADGLSNKEIASRLTITEGTVKIHAFNIYGKLQVNRRVQAVSRAKELQLLD